MLIASEDIDTIFCNIPELYRIHCDFICQLEPRVKCWTSKTQIAELFKLLVRNIYITIILKSVSVRSPQGAVLARSSRKISQTVRIDCHSFLSCAKTNKCDILFRFYNPFRQYLDQVKGHQYVINARKSVSKRCAHSFQQLHFIAYHLLSFVFLVP